MVILLNGIAQIYMNQLPVPALKLSLATDLTHQQKSARMRHTPASSEWLVSLEKLSFKNWQPLTFAVNQLVF
jgi:hypothetical protein